MKHLLLISCILVTLHAQSQKIKSYSASNGVIYHENDTLKIGRGSMPNGDFKYIEMGGWGAIASYSSEKGSSQFNVSKSYSGFNMIIKKIKEYELKGGKKIIFTVGAGNITNYVVYIENAIATCEVEPCNDGKPTVTKAAPVDPADELKKYFDLKERGAITQAEYDSIKNKLLHQ
jgi:hypothetical protein